MSLTFEAAVAAHRAGDFETAERGYRALCSNLWALHNLGALYADAGRHEDAEAALRQALKLDPCCMPARHTLGTVLLSQGRYSEGWPLYEARRSVPNTTTIDPLTIWPELPPEWDGGPLSGRLLVIGEQGFGDQIMFARFVPLLRERGIEPVGFLEANLAPLFPWASVATRRLPEGISAWVLIGSLPARLGVVDGLPAPAGLHVPSRSGGGIGVMAAGRPTHVQDQHRSLTGEDASALLSMGQDLSPAATGAATFRDTADIVAGLDLVITVDTAVAHLAASMGKPTWVLLGNHGVDWRWMAEREDSPWYPTVRLFRRWRDEPWRSVLTRAQAALAARPDLRDNHQAVTALL